MSSSLERLGMMPDASTLIGLTSPSVCPNGYPCSSLAIDFSSTTDGSITREFPLVANTELSGNEPLGLPVFRCSTAAGLCVVELSSYDPVTKKAGTGWVQVWSMDGTLVQSIETGGNDAAVSPDGQYVAVALGTGDAAVYRVSDASLVRTHHYGGGPF